MDVLICGMCNGRFCSLRAFVKHKRSERFVNCKEDRAVICTKHEAQGTNSQARNYEPNNKDPCTVESKMDKLQTSTVFMCSQCKKKFSRERHLKSHICSGVQRQTDRDTLIVHLGMDNEVEVDQDKSPDFRVYMAVNDHPRTRKRPRGSPESVTATEASPNADSSSMERRAKVPVFNTENEKQTFQDHVKAVDLTCMVNMYTQHTVTQELVEYDSSLKPKKGRSAKDLTVFSCNGCKKVFNSESHMREHCLSHTLLKPFCCPECDFSSNSKGSLQTHMRVHTGNTFRCDRCPFKTGNSTHLREHKETHLAGAVKCKLCRHFYKTRKSLRNHVLRYHRSGAGKKYLASFRAQSKSSMATLHLCQVCNKKFKRRSDRDRHQTSHQPMDDTSHCEPVDSGDSFDQSEDSLAFSCRTVHSDSEKLRQHMTGHLLEDSSPNSSQNLVGRNSECDFGETVGLEDESCRTLSVRGRHSAVDDCVPREGCVGRSVNGPEVDVVQFGASLDSLFARSASAKLCRSDVLPEDGQEGEPSSSFCGIVSDQSSDLQEYPFAGMSGHSHASSDSLEKGRALFRCPHCPRSFKRSCKDLQRHLHLHKTNSHRQAKLLPKTIRTSDEMDAGSLQSQNTTEASSVSAETQDFYTQCEEDPCADKEVEREAAEAEPGRQLFSCVGCSTTYLNFWEIRLHLKEKHGIFLDVDGGTCKESVPLQEPDVSTGSVQ